MENDYNPQDNEGCLGWLLSLFFDSPSPDNAKKESSNNAPGITLDTVTSTETESAKADYSQSYQAKYLLSKNEWYEYRKLRAIAEDRGLRVCPKVRLLDLVEPRKGEKYMSLLGRIQSKHVDFVITDKDLHIKAILELDDNSHNRPDRVERDNFVDEVLTSVGYKVLRTKSITGDILDSI